MLEVFLESWDRQARIIDNLFELVNERNKGAKPSEDGMPIYEQFAHIHNTRRFWLSKTAPEYLEHHGRSYTQIAEDDWQAIEDLSQLRELLQASAKSVRDATEKAVKSGAKPFGGYDDPVFFLQHMLWHEGYHFALITLALRLAGEEPADEWEERNVWGLWRVEE